MELLLYLQILDVCIYKNAIRWHQQYSESLYQYLHILLLNGYIYYIRKVALWHNKLGFLTILEFSFTAYKPQGVIWYCGVHTRITCTARICFLSNIRIQKQALNRYVQSLPKKNISKVYVETSKQENIDFFEIKGEPQWQIWMGSISFIKYNNHKWDISTSLNIIET